MMRKGLLAAGVAAVAVLAAGCGSSSASSGGSSGPVVLRLGFLANITHEPALVGLEKGFFAKELGKNVTLKTTVFSSGTEETTALLAGQLDAAYVGPNPAINAWQKSNGTAIKIISGAASGGASLVVKPGINSAAVLQFKSGQLDGGWEPEPYATEMVMDGGKRLVNEASLWPGGKFVTTNLMVTQSFLKDHASVVNGLLKGQVEANDYINANGQAAAQAANTELTELLGKGLDPNILTKSLTYLTFTNDPIASSLKTDAQHAVAVGLLKPVNLSGIYDLGPLNKLLKAAGEPARSQPATTTGGQLTDIRISEVSKVFGRGGSALLALDRLSLTVTPGV